MKSLPSKSLPGSRDQLAIVFLDCDNSPRPHPPAAEEGGALQAGWGEKKGGWFRSIWFPGLGHHRPAWPWAPGRTIFPHKKMPLGWMLLGGGDGDGVGGRWRVGWAFPREVSLFLTLLLYGPLWTPSKAICSRGRGPAVSDIRGQPASWRPSNILPTCSALSVKSLILSLPGFFPGQGAGGAGGGTSVFNWEVDTFAFYFLASQLKFFEDREKEIPNSLSIKAAEIRAGIICASFLKTHLVQSLIAKSPDS